PRLSQLLLHLSEAGLQGLDLGALRVQLRLQAPATGTGGSCCFGHARILWPVRVNGSIPVNDYAGEERGWCMSVVLFEIERGGVDWRIRGRAEPATAILARRRRVRQESDEACIRHNRSIPSTPSGVGRACAGK